MTAEHPGRGPAARWLVGLGALFILCFFPLNILYLRLWISQGWYREGFIGFGTVSSTLVVDIAWWNLLTVTGLHAACLFPSVLGTFRRPGDRLDRAVLYALLPLSAALGASAYDCAPGGHQLPNPLMEIPPWVAALPPAAGFGGIAAAGAAGLAPSTLAPLARRLLMLDILWILLLEWNLQGMSPRYFPGWVAATGAVLVLLGELPGRPPRLDS